MLRLVYCAFLMGFEKFYQWLALIFLLKIGVFKMQAPSEMQEVFVLEKLVYFLKWCRC